MLAYTPPAPPSRRFVVVDAICARAHQRHRAHVAAAMHAKQQWYARLAALRGVSPHAMHVPDVQKKRHVPQVVAMQRADVVRESAVLAEEEKKENDHVVVDEQRLMQYRARLAQFYRPAVAANAAVGTVTDMWGANTLKQRVNSVFAKPPSANPSRVPSKRPPGVKFAAASVKTTMSSGAENKKKPNSESPTVSQTKRPSLIDAIVSMFQALVHGLEPRPEREEITWREASQEVEAA